MSKTRQWAMLTAVVCLAVLAAGWFLVIKPQRAHAAQLRTQTQGVDANNATLQSQVAQLRQQQKDLPAQQKLLSQIATKIPDNPALPSLIRQLSASADGAGVNLVSLAPGQPAVANPTIGAATTTTTSTSTATGSSTGRAAAAPLATIPLTIQVQGTYFNVEQFFAAVESLSRAMLVTGFSLTPTDSSTSGGASTGSAATGGKALPPGTLTAQVSAQVFESPSATTTGH